MQKDDLQKYREAAIESRRDDETEILDNARVLPVPDGAWVEARLFVDDALAGVDDDDEPGGDPEAACRRSAFEPAPVSDGGAMFPPGVHVQFLPGTSKPVSNHSLDLSNREGVVVDCSGEELRVFLRDYCPELEEWGNCITWLIDDCVNLTPGNKERWDAASEDARSAFFAGFLAGLVSQA